MSKSKWIDRQIDEALLMVSTATGLLYARRRARRIIPKVIVGTAAVAAVGTATAVAATGVGILGAGGAAVAWYRHRQKAATTPADEWQMPPARRPSFVDKDPRDAVPAVAAD